MFLQPGEAVEVLLGEADPAFKAILIFLCFQRALRSQAVWGAMMGSTGSAGGLLAPGLSLSPFFLAPMSLWDHRVGGGRLG